MVRANQSGTREQDPVQSKGKPDIMSDNSWTVPPNLMFKTMRNDGGDPVGIAGGFLDTMW